MPANYPLVEIDKLPGSGDRVDLILDEGPPAPLNLEPFGPNPWAGGGQSRTNVPAFGTNASVSGSISPIWLLIIAAAILA